MGIIFSAAAASRNVVPGRHVSSRLSLLTAPILLLAGAVALAQKPEAKAAREADPRRGVYVDVSFEAQQELEVVRLLEVEGLWPQAAIRLQRIARKHGRNVVADGPDHYISLRSAIHRRIAGWPAEGLAAYRRAFDSVAEAAFEAALESNELQPLVSVAEDYFCTAAGAAATEVAAELARKGGDPAAARRWLARLVAEHPDRNELAAAKETLDKMSSEVDLATSSPSDHSWSADPGVYYGSNRRHGDFTLNATSPEARLWQTALTPGDALRSAEGAADEADPAMLTDSFDRAAQGGRLLSRLAVAGDGRLFHHDGRVVTALSLADPSRPSWTTRASDEGPTGPAWLLDETVPIQHTSLFADGRLYVPLITQNRRAEGTEATQSAALACLNAADGRLIWRTELSDFGGRFEDAALDGAPLLHDGSLYVIGRRRKAFGFEACYLLRLSAEDGKLLDHYHLGEAATGSYGYRRPTASHPAADGDLIFVQTNLGTIAAVSHLARRVEWLTTYRSEADHDSDPVWPDRGGRPIRSWNYQPVLCWRDAILCMTLDRTDVLVLDAATGRRLRRISAAVLTTPQCLAGITGDRLYAVGTSVVCYDLVARKTLWQRPLEVGQPMGQPALTRSGLFVPTDRGLIAYPLDGSAARVLSWDASEAGNLLALPDLLVVVGARAVSALTDREEALQRLAREMRRAPDDPLAALAMAELCVRIGQVEEGVQAAREAIERLQRAAETFADDGALRRQCHVRLCAISAELPAAARQWPMIARQERQGAPSTTGSTAAATVVRRAMIEFLRLAGSCATSHAEQVDYRLRLGRALDVADDATGAIDVYQQILTDPALRAEASSERMADAATDFGAESWRAAWSIFAPREGTAGHLAAARIAELIRRQGADVYANVSARARQRYEIARQMGDTTGLVETAEAYPNSASASAATALLAELHRRAGNYDAAARALHRALADRDAPDRSERIAALVRCLQAAGRAEDAAAWIARGARDDPDAPVELSGRRTTFGRLAEAQSDADAGPDAAPKLRTGNGHGAQPPRLRLYVRLYDHRAQVLEPARHCADDALHDEFLTYSDRRIEIRRSVDGKLRNGGVGVNGIEVAGEPRFISMHPATCVLAAGPRLFALSRSTGEIAWELGGEPPADPMVDPESIPVWTHEVAVHDRVYAARSDGQLICLGAEDGRVVWKSHGAQPPRLWEGDAGPATAPAVNDRFLCHAVQRDSTTEIGVRDAADGSLIATFRPDVIGPPSTLKLTRAGDLLLVQPSSVVSVGLPGGKERWRITSPTHFMPHTLQLDGDALYVSADGRRICAYDLFDGRMLWRSSPIGNRGDTGIWVERNRGDLLVACGDRLACLDGFDGGVVWESSATGCLKAQAPILAAGALLTISPERVADDAKAGIADALRGGALRGDGAGGDDPIARGRRYKIRGYDPRSGAVLPMCRAADAPEASDASWRCDDGGLVTEPIASFGGLHVRDAAILITDGRRVIGYPLAKGR